MTIRAANSPASAGAAGLVPASIRLGIGGLHCAACVARAARALEAVPGVEEAQVNLATEQADVRFGGTPPDRDRLAAALAEAGYRLTAAPGAGGEAPAVTDRREGWALWAAGLATAPFLIAMAMKPFGIGPVFGDWVALALATVVVVLAGGRFLRGAWYAVKTGVATMDVLVCLGAGTAYVYSLAAVLLDLSGPRYFEAAAVILTMVLAGKRLEAVAKRRASDAIRALGRLCPETALLVTPSGPVPVEAAALAPGDRVRVLPGGRLPADGEITEGRADLDESLLTGEPLPVAKGPGDGVHAGALVHGGALTVRVTHAAGQTRIAQMADLVAASQAAKPAIQKLVDRISALFVPLVLALAAATALVWAVVLGRPDAALANAIAVLVIACPCALGLATPAALVAGTGVAARAGLLIGDGTVFDRLGKVRHVLFDKTGTLTEGRVRVAAVHPIAGADPDQVLALAAAVEAASEHPVATAIRADAGRRGLDIPSAERFRAWPGSGVAAQVQGRAVTVGTPGFLADGGVDTGPAAEAVARADRAGQGLALVAVDGTLAGALLFEDPPRADAAKALSGLADRGLSLSVLSGDRPAAVAAVAERVRAQAGLQALGTQAGVPPEAKAAAVSQARAAHGAVAMVGDGVNDAVALAAADIGIAVAGARDVAAEAADITLMRSDLRLVPLVFQIGDRTVAKIRQNLFWAFVYNLVGLPLAALGVLPPAYAGMAMALSSVCVVSNAVLLSRWRPTLGYY